MAPAGLYTFYRAIMTVSNEVNSSPPSTVLFHRPFSFRYPFALSLFDLSYRERKQKKRRQSRECLVRIFRAKRWAWLFGDFINTSITHYFVIFLPAGAKLVACERDTGLLTVLQGSLANEGSPGIKYQEVV